jgi:hypothetical protein
MKRIGYDADSGCYYFLDSDGSHWRGEPGEQFGEMSKGTSGVTVPNFLNNIVPSVKDPPSSLQADDDVDGSHGGDLEASPRRRNGDYELLTDEQVGKMTTPNNIEV